MKIAIATEGKTLDSLVNTRFGRCPYFLIIDSESEEFKVIKNIAGQAFQGAGVSTAQMIVNKGIKAVIAGNFGPNAVNVLKNSGVKIFGGISGIIAKEAFRQYKAGKLKDITESTTTPGQELERRRRKGGK